MKITVGSILFNSETSLSKPFFTKWLEFIYGVGDEIILVEGATKAVNHYWDGDTTWATKNGKSTDNTVAIIKAFPDPLKKIKLIEKDGFWDGKTSMCNEWAKNMTGDYIWQIDHDEFYLPKDIITIKNLLETKTPDAVHFYVNHFWGDFHNCIDENTGTTWVNDGPWIRIFKHIKGSRWIRHEPPEYMHPNGNLCNRGRIIDRKETLKMGIKMFHYSCIRKEQIDFKTKFFANPDYEILWNKWHKDHNTPLINGVRTVEYKGEHPFNVKEVL